MNHPTREEWGLYLFGESAPEAQRRLKAHLAECSTCATEVQDLRETLKRLDAWQVPKASAAFPLEPVLKLAIAAVVVLALGFGVGRVTTAAPDLAALKAELRSELIAEVTRAEDTRANQLNDLVSSVEANVAARTDTALRAFGEQIIDAVNAGRQADRRETQAILERAKQQQAADYVALRRDLEIVASTTDREIREAELQLLQLAHNSPQN